MPQHPTIDVPARLSTARGRNTVLHAPARWTLEALFAVAFVIAVYELLVAGELHIWPNVPDSRILPVWVLAASLSGLGLGPVRRLARVLLRRLWPSAADDPYTALARTVAQARRTEPAEDALGRLARIAVESTGARAATIARPGVAVSASADAFPIRADGRTLGELVLQSPWSRPLRDADRRLAATLADAAGSVLRNMELTEQLDAQLRIRRIQAAELDRSRQRVVAARDEARELLGRRIRSGVDEPLAWCARRAIELRGEDIAARGPGLAELTARIDASIKEFRRIVHGVYPAALTDHGLTAALGSLVAELPQYASYEAPNLPRFAPRLEAGVYFCLAALLEPFRARDDGRDRSLRIQVALIGAELMVRVAETRAAPGARQPRWDPASLDAARDRAAALDGMLVLLGDSMAELRLPVGAETGAER